MLFNSSIFLTIFLPITLGGYLLLQRLPSQTYKYVWLMVVSLFFYAWWNPSYLLLIITSVFVNYIIVCLLSREQAWRRRVCLISGLLFNLGLLGYYKYSTFFLNIYRAVREQDPLVHDILLPLGISFFTFQQITYLIDAYNKNVDDRSLPRYATFVTFFPQLIAGPIVHHREMMPQFRASLPKAVDLRTNLAIGVSIFTIGLFKKVVIADNLAQIASPVFADAANDSSVSFTDAWLGALAYTFQLYFDFSGYSDMAIGLARMFGIILPVNFLSPYKSTGIIEFWRRWHITLSRFLRDYLYIPLGGNRRGEFIRYRNILITMVIGGLWHGAGWTFIIWGALHGTGMCVNQLWNRFVKTPDTTPRWLRGLRRAAAWGVTFVFVVIGWVFFRAESFQAAQVMLQGMFDLSSIEVPGRSVGRFADQLERLGIEIVSDGHEEFTSKTRWIAGSLAICLLTRNIVELFRPYQPVLETAKVAVGEPPRYHWRPTMFHAVAIGILAFFALREVLVSTNSEFLYFNF